MKQIIKEDYPFVKSHISISQALDFYKKTISRIKFNF